MANLDGLTQYSGPITYGRRDDLGGGGENSRWGIGPSGKEQPLIGGYLISDLMQRFGNLDAIRSYGRLTPGSEEWNIAQMRAGDTDPGGMFAEGPFAQDIANFNRRPSDDSWSGNSGFHDALELAAIAAPAFGGWLAEGTEAAAPAAGGTAAASNASSLGMFAPEAADTLDTSLIGPSAGAAPGSESIFAPGGAGMSAPMYQTNTFGPEQLGLSATDPTALGGGNFASPDGFSPAGAGPNAIDFSGFGSDFDSPGMPGFSTDAGGGGLSDWWKRMSMKNFIPGGLSIGSGLYGMYQASQMQKLAKQAMDRSDPFGPQRAQYQKQLQDLYANPSAVENLPGYKAGLTAVERKMASQGYNGSGNMMLALHDYGGRMFDNEANRLATLAGAGMAPNAGPAVSAASGANNLRSASLASLAFGSRFFV